MIVSGNATIFNNNSKFEIKNVVAFHSPVVRCSDCGLLTTGQRDVTVFASPERAGLQPSCRAGARPPGHCRHSRFRHSVIPLFRHSLRYSFVSFVQPFVNLVVKKRRIMFYHKGHKVFHKGHKSIASVSISVSSVLKQQISPSYCPKRISTLELQNFRTSPFRHSVIDKAMSMLLN